MTQGRQRAVRGMGKSNGRGRLAAAVLVLAGTAGSLGRAGVPALHATEPAAEPPVGAVATPAAAPAPASAAAGLIEREVAALRGGPGTRPVRPVRPAAADSLEASEAEYAGWKTFHVYCYRCHGTDAVGSDLAPNLRQSVSEQGSVTHDVFVTTVKEGRVPKGMPAWKAVLDDEQIEQLYAYVKARSEKRLAAGRPRRRQG